MPTPMNTRAVGAAVCCLLPLAAGICLWAVEAGQTRWVLASKWGPAVLLALYTLRLQAIGLSLSANNGMYAATDAHDLALVSGDAPTIHSVHPVSAVPGESITILGESFVEPASRLSLGIEHLGPSPTRYSRPPAEGQWCS